ncbi:hypothetical protein PMZ80_010468 [Knufia obscura]|uniref:Lytic polysaccharide monooxygenase 9 n=1 Tax=Knufia obscura TaxID=1635080 RepID=A0ABR0R972_9EURO|nr:hypothetical protein PMZ80_010468 [Knufia obscura]
MKTFTSLLALAAAAHAHMIMKTPTPAGNPNNSPLLDNGDDFPCKGAGDQVATGPLNTMPVGVPQTLSFTGSAVHGGGSCQISLAKGTKPDKNTKWMVIHSIEGGCPANVAGNLPENASGDGAAKFQFSIPDHPDITAGEEHTLAWTWNNKVGNREMYMNCARVMVQGAAKKRYAPSNMPVSKRQAAPLPDMFVANIGNGCTVPEGTDVKYPNPGESVEQAQGAALGAPQGNCGAAGGSNPPAGTSASTPGATSAPAVSNSVAPVAPSSTADSGQYTQTGGGVFATVPADASSATQAPVATSAAAATTATSAAAPIGTGTGSAAPPASGSCEVGAWNCSADGSSFSRCVAGGTWSASIPMAAGMSCTPGVSMNFAYNASAKSNAKRDLRSHVSRRRHNAHGAALS